MEVSEILKKIAELKELAAKAEALAFEIHSDVVGKMIEARDARDAYLTKGKDIDRTEFIALGIEAARFEEMTSRIETATYKLTQEVIGNLNKIS